MTMQTILSRALASGLLALALPVLAQQPVTTYSYDDQGNLTGIAAPLGRNTASAYDALNRLKQMTDPASGQVAYGYNALDQLTSVTDPRGLVTQYQYNALGDLKQQLSPDTGTTTHTLDAAGNVLTRTNADGTSATYSYDALNRVTQISYSDGQTETFTYDQGANGLGRLTGIADSSGTTTYTYDAHGRVTQETRVIAGQSSLTAYGYDTAGRLASMTYPSGRVLTYTRDGLGRIAQIDTSGNSVTQVLVQGVTYFPFGGVKGFSYGSLAPYARSFDLEGRIASYTQGAATKSVAYDLASRITGITDGATPATNSSYGYDALDRLTSAVLATSTYGYTYDPTGNRLSRSTGSGTDTYSYGPTSNRLASITGPSGSQSYVHDANGSVTSDGASTTFTYDARTRLVASVSAAGTTSYVLNALGQRVRKSSPLGDRVFHYDQDGRLIAESDAAGQVIREYVWLGDLPVAVLAASPAQGPEVVVDNTDAGFSASGTWPASTSVAGYLGANYQSHEAGGAPPGAIVVDNTDAGFSTTGTWSASTSVGGYLGTNYQHHYANGEPPAGVVADNSQGTAVGTWNASTSVGGYYGTNYQAHAAGSGTESFTWTLAVPTAGTYEVYARWTQHPNRASDAKYTVNHAGGASQVSVNQEMGGGSWQLLGTYTFDAGNATVSVSDQANGYVIADAVMLAPPGAAPNTATWTLAVPETKPYRVYARWTAHPNRATNAKYTVNHAGGADTLTVNQAASGGSWTLLGTYGFNAGIATVSLTDQADGYVIADAIRLDPADGPTGNSATWSPSLAPGSYAVYARWTAHANRASNAAYTVTHSGGDTQVAVDQRQGGGAWNLLGSFTLNAQSKVTLTDMADGYVIADAVRFVPTGGQSGGTTVYYVHPDHLSTPRLVTSDAGQVVWRWEQSEPFGNIGPEEDPDGDANAFAFPLRFPGQYADQETNSAYNVFRDYDPATGRYIQSDPIGLAGGLNTYGYVSSSPVALIDPSGLEIYRSGNSFSDVPFAGSRCEQAVVAYGTIIRWDPCDPTTSRRESIAAQSCPSTPPSSIAIHVDVRIGTDLSTQRLTVGPIGWAPIQSVQRCLFNQMALFTAKESANTLAERASWYDRILGHRLGALTPKLLQGTGWAALMKGWATCRVARPPAD